jgi:amino-acid N-acetyltransferase
MKASHSKGLNLKPPRDLCCFLEAFNLFTESLTFGGSAMTVEPFAEADKKDILRLLSEENLPTEDLNIRTLENFLVAREGNGATVGAVGVEVRLDAGLLRSLVVHPSYRGRGLGKQLTSEIETYARGLGAKTLFLLTMTAADFFPRLGYQPILRSDVPQSIAETFEFKSACPVSAVCLYKNLG